MRHSAHIRRSPLACLLGALACSGPDASPPDASATSTTGESTTSTSSVSATSTSGASTTSTTDETGDPPAPVCADAIALAGPGFVIDGGSPDDHVVAIPCADVNGDGLDDILLTIERPTQLLGFLVFGKTDEASVDLKEVEAGEDERGILLDWDPDGDAEDFYHSLAGVGDVNGDGIADFAATLGIAHQSGRVHVVFGDADLAGPLPLPAVADGSSGFTFSVDEVAVAGLEVAGVGDINGDGFGDLVVVVHRDFSPDIYVIFGGTAPLTPTPASLAAGKGGFLVGTLYGGPALGPADVDGDGSDDLILTDFGGVFWNVTGAMVVYGGPDLAGFKAMDLKPDAPGVSYRFSDYEGPYLNGFNPVAAAGDVNGDGLGDVVLVEALDPGGTAYVILGSASATDIELPGGLVDRGYTVDLGGLTLPFPSFDSRLEIPTLLAVGDRNGDGRDDLVFRTTSGTYLLHGKDDLAPQVLGVDGVLLDDLPLGAHLGVAAGWAALRGGAPDDLVIADPDADLGECPGAGRALVLFDALELE